MLVIFIRIAALMIVTMIATSWGKQTCKSNEETLIHCGDTYSKVGFCCKEKDGFYLDCCFYTKVWALWYFWFGIVLFLLLLAGCAGGGTYYKRTHSGNSDTSSNSSAAARVEQVAFVVAQPQPESEQTAPFNDAPPSYQQLSTLDQAIVSQENEMEKYEAGVEKTN